jgi:serine/threonine protein kinase
MVHALLFL